MTIYILLNRYELRMQQPAILLLFLFLFNITVNGQNISYNDTVVIYNTTTKSSYYKPYSLTIDTTQKYLQTNWSMGANTTRSSLNNNFTFSNPNSKFSLLTNAQSIYQEYDFPISTSVQLLYTHNGIRRPLCSGTVVGRNKILTAKHCFYNASTKMFIDSIWVAPCRDNGSLHPDFQISRAINYYMFEAGLSSALNADIGLLEVADNLGDKTGWLSFSYVGDTSFFKDRPLHKFSYPHSSFDTAIKVNGDTLYYQYGYGQKATKFLSVINPTSFPAGGQSGSSLFYTNNNDTNVAFGVLSVGLNLSHTMLTRGQFHVFKDIATSLTNSINQLKEVSFDIYPNPTNSFIKIKVNEPFSADNYVSMYTMNGQKLISVKIQQSETHLQVDRFPKGVYVLELKNAKGVSRKKLVIN